MSEERTGRYVGVIAMGLISLGTGFDISEMVGWMAGANATVFALAAFGLLWHVVKLRKLALGGSLPPSH